MYIKKVLKFMRTAAHLTPLHLSALGVMEKSVRVAGYFIKNNFIASELGATTRHF